MYLFENARSDLTVRERTHVDTDFFPQNYLTQYPEIWHNLCDPACISMLSESHSPHHVSIRSNNC